MKIAADHQIQTVYKSYQHRTRSVSSRWPKQAWFYLPITKARLCHMSVFTPVRTTHVSSQIISAPVSSLTESLNKKTRSMTLNFRPMPIKPLSVALTDMLPYLRRSMVILGGSLSRKSDEIDNDGAYAQRLHAECQELEAERDNEWDVAGLNRGSKTEEVSRFQSVQPS